MLKYFLPVLVGLGLLALGPGAAEAQRGGGHGGGHGGGGHPGGGHPGGGHPGGGNFHRGGGAFFYGGFYPGYAGPWYGYGYGPGYYDYGYAVAPPVYQNPIYVNPVSPVPPAAPLNNTAEIDVYLPHADAKVWVDGHAMTSGSGTQRAFMSPSLEPGYSYSYRVTATWMENGQEVRVERSVAVAPGRVSRVDFASASSAPTMPPVQD